MEILGKRHVCFDYAWNQFRCQIQILIWKGLAEVQIKLCNTQTTYYKFETMAPLDPLDMFLKYTCKKIKDMFA